MSTRRGDGQPPFFIATGLMQPLTATDGPHFANMFHSNASMALNNVKVTNTADNTRIFTNTSVQHATTSGHIATTPTYRFPQQLSPGSQFRNGNVAYAFSGAAGVIEGAVFENIAGDDSVIDGHYDTTNREEVGDEISK
ncbi:hypothetical protein BDQ12DRAFT_670149 [Crucibulum laeve]|uniref:Uncharacterized protein n=1 Tax=Crucibulum laeve TaxID=68775 RepID=A0A5C3LMW9_9AGAR|nr:hypothetical protein BDQ12DRAFT_670149 [Crucibulum laeve]